MTKSAGALENDPTAKFRKAEAKTRKLLLAQFLTVIV
jgi:hypothetical protein